MAIGSGLSAQFGCKKETTYGTRVVPDKFWLATAEAFALDRNYIQSAALGSGATFEEGGLFVPTTKDVNGQLNGEVPNKQFGTLLDGLHGNTVTPVQQGTTTAYKQTHDIGLTDPDKSYTFQIGKPSVDGTVRPFDYLGCKITGAQFACETGGFLTYQFTFDGQDEDTAQALATRSLPTGLAPFNFTQGAVLMGGTTPVARVRSFTLTLTKGFRVDRYALSSSALKAKPIMNARETAELTLNTEFADLTNYNRFVTGAAVAVVLTFTGANIASTYNSEFKITATQVFTTGSTPQVDGPDLLDQELPCVIKYDGTNAPVRVEYTSTDTTI